MSGQTHPVLAGVGVEEVNGAVLADGRQPLTLHVHSDRDARKGKDALLAKDLREIVRSDLMLSRHFDVKDEAPGADYTASGKPGRRRRRSGADDVVRLKEFQDRHNGRHW